MFTLFTDGFKVETQFPLVQKLQATLGRSKKIAYISIDERKIKRLRI